ncbi:hypothetical protein BURMUCGD1_4357 [Burkholderia multivorans CGD1]|nr:hypothetical protein BURMUCGD1_4357 [Burkholderia multivorans CGD1]
MLRNTSRDIGTRRAREKRFETETVARGSGQFAAAGATGRLPLE